MNQQLAVNIGQTFGSPFGTNPNYSVGSLISLFLRGSFVLAGLIILFFFIFGGLQIIQGAGSDSPQSVAQGKQALTSALIGLVIVFGAYWIVRIIEIMTKSNFITSPSIPGL